MVHKRGGEGFVAAPFVKVTHPWWNNGKRSYWRFRYWSIGGGALVEQFPQHTYRDYAPNAAECLCLCLILATTAVLFGQWRIVAVCLEAFALTLRRKHPPRLLSTSIPPPRTKRKHQFQCQWRLLGHCYCQKHAHPILQRIWSVARVRRAGSLPLHWSSLRLVHREFRRRTYAGGEDEQRPEGVDIVLPGLLVPLLESVFLYRSPYINYTMFELNISPKMIPILRQKRVG